MSKEMADEDSTIKYFSRRAQARRLLLSCGIRWLVSLVLCGAIAGAVYGYAYNGVPGPGRADFDVHTYGTISSRGKDVFQTLVTGFQIGLAINLTDALTQFAQILRWHLTSRYPLDPKNFDRILGLDNAYKALRTFVSMRKVPFLLRFFCLAWLIVFLAANIGSATIGLTYDVFMSADVSYYTTYQTGKAQITNLSQIVQYPNQPLDDVSQRVAAQNFVAGGQPNVPLLLPENYDVLIPYTGRDGLPGFSLNMSTYGEPLKDTVINNNQIYSTRVVRAVANCTNVRITQLQGPNATSPNSATVTYPCGTDECTLLVGNDLNNTLTVATNPSVDPGPRSAQMMVLLARVSGTNATLYDCNNTVLQVANARSAVPGYENNAQAYEPIDRPDLLMPDYQARTWAGAMGWSAGDDSQTQQNSYANSVYINALTGPGPLNENSTTIANLLTAYTLGALSAYDTGISLMNVSGVPTGADSFTVVPHTTYVATNLALIAGLHLLVMLVVVATVWNIKVVDESPLVMAAAMRNAVASLGPGGAMLDDYEATALAGHRIQYGWRWASAADVKTAATDPAAARREVYIGNDDDGVHQGSFPEGFYY